ncbi:hypothetical protein K7711_31915 [Nocardia sp. CA2R105]|uniref:hypothetical protein n=1 Tax=Nocardia coffeae TaxID=2873381 RepID=UPI001CA710F6|nr:hypothetical protein [Nocardia coffeae]MBY8861121.1 hypothetical protein [Nocardia coffeae]
MSAREHLDRLQAAGVPANQIAKLAGINHSVLSRLPNAVHITRRTEAAILAVDVPEDATAVVQDTALVPSVGAVRRIQALVASGYTQTELARELGIDPANMRPLTGRPAGDGRHLGEEVTAGRHRQIAELFDRLQMTPGASERSRELGKKLGWALPFEWDEDQIDDPAAQPTRSRWTPTSGRIERRSSRIERREQVAHLTELGMSAGQIAVQLGVTGRTVVRDRHLSMSANSQQPQIDWGLDR